MQKLENSIQCLEQYNKLIWSIVHKVLSETNDKYYYNGLEEDLFQEGYIGLILASQRFDETTNIQFTTFAYKYIYGYCLNFIKKECCSLNAEDINNSPTLSEGFYEMDDYFDIDLIKEINNNLKIVNKKLTQLEENVLKDKLYKELSFRECAKFNNCSTKKVINIIEKYKDLIKDILTK